MGYRVVNFMFDFDVFTESEVESMRQNSKIRGFLRASDKVYSTAEEAQIEADRLAEEMNKENAY